MNANVKYVYKAQNEQQILLLLSIICLGICYIPHNAGLCNLKGGVGQFEWHRDIGFLLEFISGDLNTKNKELISELIPQTRLLNL